MRGRNLDKDPGKRAPGDEGRDRARQRNCRDLDKCMAFKVMTFDEVSQEGEGGFSEIERERERGNRLR